MRNIKLNIQKDFINLNKLSEKQPDVKTEKFEKLNYTENIIYYIQRFGEF